MKFSEISYHRPDLEAYSTEFLKLVESFSGASTAEDAYTILIQIQKLRNDFETQSALAYARYSINTRDPELSAEQEFFDSHGPQYEALIQNYLRALTKSPHRDYLEKRAGSQIFALADVQLRTFKDEIMDDLATEASLRTDYMKLQSQALIHFEGENRNLSQMGTFTVSADRDLRHRAYKALYGSGGYYESVAGHLDTIFGDLVRVRHGMARSLGYENFIPLGYARMNRTDYGPVEVGAFRKQIRELFVPLAQEIISGQQQRLGIPDFSFADESLKFPGGNAKPKGTTLDKIQTARAMYDDLSPETGDFFRSLAEGGYFDLESRDGKSAGGYCTYFANARMPFIFANFNDTAGDIEVLTHEAGHAFQSYRSRNHEFPEYYFPTLEACEIHSMSMEFLTYNYMEDFFGEDAEKFRYGHLADALTFLPYAALVDEFQHEIYVHPEMSPEERHGVWRRLEGVYLPHRKYDNLPFLDKGGYWQRQGHIFQNPFYYIDYALAQICALQFWYAARQDSKEAWARYLKLCDAGGSRSFTGLLDLAGLKSPFSGSLTDVADFCREYLRSADTSRF